MDFLHAAGKLVSLLACNLANGVDAAASIWRPHFLQLINFLRLDRAISVRNLTVEQDQLNRVPMDRILGRSGPAREFLRSLNR
jgi:hypothetical protein